MLFERTEASSCSHDLEQQQAEGITRCGGAAAETPIDGDGGDNTTATASVFVLRTRDAQLWFEACVNLRRLVDTKSQRFSRWRLSIDHVKIRPGEDPGTNLYKHTDPSVSFDFLLLHSARLGAAHWIVVGRASPVDDIGRLT